MNRQEAANLLDLELNRRYGELAWDDLVEAIETKRIDDFTFDSPNGKRYQIEVNFVWDSGNKSAARVLGMIDDGGLSAWLPVGRDLLIQKSTAKR